jgi:hypothetical protein
MDLKDPNYASVDPATSNMMRGFLPQLRAVIGQYIPLAQKAAASGVPSLDANSKVVQDPASKGAANGLASLNASQEVVERPAFTVLTTDALAVGTVYALAHGLGRQPAMFFETLVCDSAEGGFSAGDEIGSSFFYDGTNNRRFQVSADATNITVITSGTALTLMNKSTGANFNATMNKWKIRVRVL